MTITRASGLGQTVLACVGVVVLGATWALMPYDYTRPPITRSGPAQAKRTPQVFPTPRGMTSVFPVWDAFTSSFDMQCVRRAWISPTQVSVTFQTRRPHGIDSQVHAFIAHRSVRDVTPFVTTQSKPYEEHYSLKFSLASLPNEIVCERWFSLQEVNRVSRAHDLQLVRNDRGQIYAPEGYSYLEMKERFSDPSIQNITRCIAAFDATRTRVCGVPWSIRFGNLETGRYCTLVLRSSRRI